MSSPRILIVDDEADIRSLLREILSEEGYEVDVAADASQARASRARQDPDLVLLDIWMPDVDGTDALLSKLQKTRIRQRVLMIKPDDGSSPAPAPRARKSEGSYGDKPRTTLSRPEKPYGEKKPFGDKKPYGEKSFGDKKPYGEKKAYGDKKAAPGKSFGDKKPYGGGFKKDGSSAPKKKF